MQVCVTQAMIDKYGTVPDQQTADHGCQMTNVAKTPAE